MYNFYRDKRNDFIAVILALALGWFADSAADFSTLVSILIAVIGFATFRIGIAYSPWSDRIPIESNEHTNSTPWQPMRDLDEIRYAPESAYERNGIE
ncbi:hypothetical protein KHP62_00080 [Rhodobacteraceae bacterium NNCM2]|nr:hypothetical protein [Coraliihabitans acroporae]